MAGEIKVALYGFGESAAQQAALSDLRAKLDQAQDIEFMSNWADPPAVIFFCTEPSADQQAYLTIPMMKFRAPQAALIVLLVDSKPINFLRIMNFTKQGVTDTFMWNADYDPVEAVYRVVYGAPAESDAMPDAPIIEQIAPPILEPIRQPQVFISYSRLDWTDYAEKIVAFLRPRGFEVWVDQHLLEGGDDWMDEINAALETSHAMILCISPDALASRNVKMEYRYFLDENKPLIPVMCRPVEKLPAELRRIQYQPFDLEKLANRLNSLFNGSSYEVGHGR